MHCGSGWESRWREEAEARRSRYEGGSPAEAEARGEGGRRRDLKGTWPPRGRRGLQLRRGAGGWGRGGGVRAGGGRRLPDPGRAAGGGAQGGGAGPL